MDTHGPTCAATVLGVLLAGAALGQTASTTAPSAAPTADAGHAAAADGVREWSLGPVVFSGLLDGYYSLNFNHPATSFNEGRNFDVKANEFSLNMAKLTLEDLPNPLGFRLDLGFGRTFDIVNANSSPTAFRYIEQAYLSYKPAAAHGLELDFGKFVTSAGAEVIETKDNWNYSRSFLFAYAIPYYHFGLRAMMPVGKHLTAGVHLVNGWNVVEDNNSGKTAGFTAALSVGKVTWNNTYYVGPENPGNDRGLRHMYDTNLVVTASTKTSFYLNFDYGVNHSQIAGAKHWVGVAGAGRYALNRWFALAPRVEWFNDAGGFTTGTVQKLREATMTAEFKLHDGLLSRLEYRRDWSTAPFFDRGASPAGSKNQQTLLASLVAYFGPKR